MEKQNLSDISSTIRGNAFSAYLMILVCIFLLFNTENKNINHPFVKAHVKAAFSLHIGFFVTYFIFISQQLFAEYSFWGISVADIIAKSILFFFLGLLVIWMYRALKWNSFHIIDTIYKQKSWNLLDINRDNSVDEKDKLGVIISYIPFIWLIHLWKYIDSPIINHATRINIFFSTLASLFWYFNFSSVFYLLLLWYSIFVVFIGINLFIRNELIELQIPKVLSFSDSESFFIILCKYIKNYFSNNDFITFNKLSEQYNKAKQEQQIVQNKEILNLPTNNLAKFLIYIPFINIIFLFIKDEKYKYHIRNALILNMILLIAILFDIFGSTSSWIYVFFIFPILFGIGQLKNNIAYKMPYVYWITKIFIKIKSIFIKTNQKIQQERKKEVEIIGKVK